jgi:hypothetical protein
MPSPALPQLQHSSAQGYELWKRLSRAHVAVCAALDAKDRVLLGTRHYVRQQFGGWDKAAMNWVVDWLVAEHSLTPEEAEALPLPELLAKLQAKAADTSPTPTPKASGAQDGEPDSLEATCNVLRLEGEVWHVRYEEGDEQGNFRDQRGSIFRHLARLLAVPYRRFGALEFYPPPIGAAPLPHLGRDESSDDHAMKQYEMRMRQLAEEIKEADDAHDAETANKLRTEFDALKGHLGGEKAARNRGHRKRCGTLAPEEKADQALRVGLGKLRDRLRAKGLPSLADHLDEHIDNGDCQWWYAPPPGTSTWHVTQPAPLPEK